MIRRTTCFVPLLLLAAGSAVAQSEGRGQWRTAEGPSPAARTIRPVSDRYLDSAPRREEADAFRRAAGPARRISGPPGLPADHGQVWAEYDISPYTRRVGNTNRPEQAIIDWVLRETGYETWHSDVLAVLNADRNTLRTYHTPEVQDVVAAVVDRFVSSEAETQAFGLRVITLAEPDWRARAARVMKPVEVQTQGVQAWLLEREDAALLFAELSKRSDFRQDTSAHMLVPNGQSDVISQTRTRNFVQDVALKPTTFPGFEAVSGRMEEGYALEFHPLLSQDGGTIDAVLKCHIDQVERLRPVMIDVPTTLAPRQRTQVDVPQVGQFRLHERFRWPADQVLLVALGVVPSPHPVSANPFRLSFGYPEPARVEMLVVVENKGRSAQAPVGRTGRAAKRGHGRY